MEKIKTVSFTNIFILSIMILCLCLFSNYSTAQASSKQILTIDEKIEFFESKGCVNDNVINELNQINLKNSKRENAFNSLSISNEINSKNICKELSELNDENISRSVDINEKQQVIFYKNGYFVVNEIKESVPYKSSKSNKSYKTASNANDIYKQLITGENQKFATVTVEGDFWYDGSKAGVENVKGNYKSHVILLNTKTFETKAESFDRGAGARAVTRGVFTTDYGIYQIGELPFDVRVSVTSDGKVWKSK